MRASAYLITLLLFSAVIVHAQYTSQRSSFTTIGGKSTGGTYSLHSAVGPAAAGAVAGGSYSVASSPWSLIAVETPGAPTLHIYRSNAITAVVAWPSPSTGFVLQENSIGLSSTNWTDHPFPQDDGTIKYIIVSPPTGSRFYRLFKP